MNFRNALVASVMASGLLFSSLEARADLVLNGSFEDSSIDPGSFTTLSAGSTAITGWTISSGSVDYIGTYWTAQNGSRSLDLDGGAPGGIQASQAIATTVGQQYLVSFWLAANPDGGPNPKTVDVSFGSSGPESFAFTPTGTTKDNMGWQLFSFTYTATDALSDLSFLSTTDGAYGPALDNVSVDAVPEASTWAMLLLGFLGVGFLAYRKGDTMRLA
jgi:choice-of-anchor C domain-containing protein